MNLVEVIPISKAISKESLSYFTSKKISPGSLISINLRGKKAKALVLGSKKVSKSKAELRSSDYSIKKISDDDSQKLFLEEFIESSKDLSIYSASSTGAVLYSLIPKIILEKVDSIKKVSLKNSGDIHEKYIIQAGLEDRFADYKSITREQIAKNKSVIILTPTSKLAENTFTRIQKGIKDYCHLIHHSLKKLELEEVIKKVMDSEKPVIVVMTSKFLSIPRSDIGAIILEKENSSFYKSKRRPFVDTRTFVEFFSKRIGAKLYLSDLYLRTETLWRFREGEFIEFKPIRQRVTSSAKQTIVDMKADNSTRKHTIKGFKIVSPQLERTLKKAIKEKKKLFLFSARKGLNPLTVCGDCGQPVLCGRCDSPLVLHNSKSKNFFLCHKCGRTRDAETRCLNCNSWKLVPMGIGIELVEKKLKEHFKNLKLFKIDGDSTPTPQKAQKVFDQFQLEKDGILLGTEMAINYLDEIDYSGVISIDSFFSIPDFRINEKIINLLLSIREKTKEEFIIQTRNSEQEVLKFVKSSNLASFYKSEIKQRKDFNFPPFFDFIKISFSGTKDSVISEGKKLKEFFEDYDISIYPAFVSVFKGRVVMNALISIPRGGWPDNILREKILALPQKFAVDVNPDNLL